jgi:biopolymer transport protein ExbB/TolQ
MFTEINDLWMMIAVIEILVLGIICNVALLVWLVIGIIKIAKSIKYNFEWKKNNKEWFNEKV